MSFVLIVVLELHVRTGHNLCNILDRPEIYGMLIQFEVIVPWMLEQKRAPREKYVQTSLCFVALMVHHFTPCFLASITQKQISVIQTD